MSLGLVSVIRNPVPSPGLVRPSLDEPMQPLKVVVADSLRTQLEKLIIEQQEPVSIGKEFDFSKYKLFCY